MEKKLSLTFLLCLLCTTCILSIFSMEQETNERSTAYSLRLPRSTPRRNALAQMLENEPLEITETHNGRERERRSRTNELLETGHAHRTLGSGHPRRDQAISSNTFRARYLFTRTTVEKIDAPMIDQSVAQEDKSIEVTHENFSEMLHSAVVKNDCAKLKVLLSSYPAKEFDPNLLVNQIETPLYRAVKDKNLPMVQALCDDPRIIVDTPNELGETALFAARIPEIIECLVFKGADPHYKDTIGISPLNYAEGLSDKNILMSLKVQIVKEEKAKFIKQQEEKRLERLQNAASEDKITEDTHNNPLCSICLESGVILESSEDATQITGPFVHYFTCTHHYHETCIKSSIQSGSRRCPLCRAGLKDAQLIPLGVPAQNSYSGISLRALLNYEQQEEESYEIPNLMAMSEQDYRILVDMDEQEAVPESSRSSSEYWPWTDDDGL